ncbi:MAG: amidohydrolase [Nitrospirae bacterium]|nr:amidohydrolase [Nitrospirota bacterium]
MDSDFTVIENGAIAVKDGRIISVGTSEDVRKQYSSEKVIGGKDTVAFPGLVNTHTHSPMVLFRGLEDDLPLKIWLEEHIWPAENTWLSSEFVGDAVELACLEMLKAGITLVNDMYFFGDVIARTVKKFGMRAVVGAGILDFPSKTAHTPDEYLAQAEAFIRDWKGDDLITPALAPHAPYTCSPETMLKTRKISDRYMVPVHTHLSETQWESGEMKRRYGKTSVQLLEDLGVLDERFIAAHCVWLTDEEIDILARRRVGVSHCIESNLKLASGIAPVVKMLNAGVRVTFGTDGAASNNDLNILSEASTAAKVHKAVSGDPTALNARQAMLMATRWGAQALGLGDVTGSIEEGKAADIVLAGLRKPHLVPIYDIYSHLIYAMNAGDIDTVIINGKVVINRRELTTGDESEIMDRALVWEKKIRSSRAE